MPDEEKVLVRGVAITAIMDYVKDRLGEEGCNDFLKRFPRDFIDKVLNVGKADWYPVDVISRLRNEVALEFNSQDQRQAAFDIGVFTATYEQSTFLKSIMRHLPIPLILRQAAALWRKFYRPGVMKVVETGDRKVILELTDFPPVDPLICPQFEAWLVSAGRNQNLENFEVKETLCLHKGKDRCRWELTWS